MDNIGFGRDSTHTKPWSTSRITTPDAQPLTIDRHPDTTAVREDLDAAVFTSEYARPALTVRLFRAARSLSVDRLGRRENA